jgi:hypothetical protein
MVLHALIFFAASSMRKSVSDRGKEAGERRVSGYLAVLCYIRKRTVVEYSNRGKLENLFSRLMLNL